MAEDLLHHADVDALFEQERGSRMASVVHPGRPDTGFPEDRAPVMPVVLGGQRAARGPAEHQVPVLPGRACGHAGGELGLAMGAQVGDQGLGERQDERGRAAAGFNALTAGEEPAAPDALRALSRVVGAAVRAGPLYLGAAMATLAAVHRAAVMVPMLLAFRWAGPAVAAFGACGRVAAAVPVSGPLELPANLDHACVEIDVLPAQPERLALADAERPGRPTSGRRSAWLTTI